jgi:23S rRNA pseudouridine2605 synthase
MVTAMSDPEGRPTVGDLVEGRKERLFHVGRLDAETEGLLLLTNDGELAHRLTHPSYEVPKTYLAEVLGPVARDVGRQLRDGVELEDGMARVDSFRLVDSHANRVLLEIVLHEGRKHIVRRMLAAVGHPVQQLVRTQVGPVHLGDQRAGKLRSLTPQEVAAVYALVGL